MAVGLVRRIGRALGAVRVKPRLRRPLLAVLVVLVSSLAMGADSPSTQLTASRLSGPMTLDPAAAVSPVVLANADVDGTTGGARRGGAEYYRRITRKHVAPAMASEFVPLYREAQRSHSVNWRLIASIHRQETAFSTADTTYHGLNAFGCCAGPMQFNVTNGPVSTWKTYRQAFRAGKRPARYPHPTQHHPSIYDDFDAIMAAGSLLRDSGAGLSLDGSAWSAAYAYYGHDLFGVTYASQVLARAAAWQRDGFCANCEPDAALVDEFEVAYGAAIREALLAEEERKKHKKKKGKKGDRERALEQAREAQADRALAERDSRRHDARRRAGEAPVPAPDDAPADPAPPTADPSDPSDPPTTSTPAAPPPAAPAPVCTGVRKLLGC
jgi:hypothetical protein